MNNRLTAPRDAAAEPTASPKLLFFYSASSGRCRRVEGFLAQVLQRRHNHATFSLYRIDCESRSDLAERFGVAEPPALVVVDGRRIAARLDRPRGCVEIQTLLAPWLR